MRIRTKRVSGLISLAIVAFILATTILQAIPVHVYAASRFNQTSDLLTRAKIWSEYQVLLRSPVVGSSAQYTASYMVNPPICKGISWQDTDVSERASGKWFGGNAQMGLHVDPSDGDAQCDNTQTKWLSHLLDAAGQNGNYTALYEAAIRAAPGKEATTLVQAVYSGLFVDSSQGNVNSQFATGGLIGPLGSNEVDAIVYAILLNAFTAQNGCKATSAAGMTNDQLAPYRANGRLANIYFFDPGVNVNPTNYIFEEDAGKVVSVGPGIPGDGGNDGKMECRTVAQMLSNNKYATAAQTWYAATPGAQLNISGITGSGASPAIGCEGVDWKNPLSWLFCSILNAAEQSAKKLDAAIVSLLTIDTNRYFNNGGSTTQCAQGNPAGCYYRAWSVFRNLALAILLIAGLVMVVSQIAGVGILDAYTIKKVLPRLLVAIVAISLSWQLSTLAISFFNALGKATASIIFTPFSGLSGVEVGLGLSSLASVGIVGGFVAYGLLASLSIVLTAALAAFVGYVLLIFRQIAIIFLAILSPLAIAFYILPGTEKYYKLWWESFSKGLMMFPILMGFIAIGRVFAQVSASSGSEAGNLIAVIAYFAPYFLIPTAFKMAGGLIGRVAGITNDRTKGGFDALSNFRKKERSGRVGYKMDNARERILQKRYNAYKKVRDRTSQIDTSTLGGKMRARAMRGVAGQVAGFHGREHGGNIEAAISALNAKNTKLANDQIATGPDTELRALAVDKEHSAKRVNAKGATEYQTLGGAWVGEAAVDAAYARWGHDTATKQAVLAYEMRKAITEEDVQRIQNNFGGLAVAWDLAEKNATTGAIEDKAGAGELWIGAAYANQNQHLEFKHSNWNNGSLKKTKLNYTDSAGVAQTVDSTAGESLITETYNNRGSYNASQLNAESIAAMIEAHSEAAAVEKTLGAKGVRTRAEQVQFEQAQRTVRESQGVAETFMSRFGASGPAGGGADDEAMRAAAAAAGGLRGSAGMEGTFTTQAAGSGRTNELVHKLAKATGVYQPKDPEPRVTGPMNNDPQN